MSMRATSANTAPRVQLRAPAARALRATRAVQGARSVRMATTMAGFYDYSPNSIDGAPVPLTQYKGKVIMVQNIATH
jgi:hypothetical protein